MKGWFSDPKKDDTAVPLLNNATDNNQNKPAKLLTVEEIQALPPGALALRLNDIRNRYWLSANEQMKVAVSKVIEPNLLENNQLRRETVSCWVKFMQEYAHNRTGISLPLSFDKSQELYNSKVPLWQLCNRIIEYKHNHMIVDMAYFNSLILEHFREVFKLLIAEFSDVTGFKYYSKEEFELMKDKKPATGITVVEANREFRLTIWW